MKTLLILLVLSAGLIAGLIWQTHHLSQELASANQTLGQQKNTLIAQEVTINTLQETSQHNTQAQAELQAKTEQAGQLATTRSREITRLLNENKNLRRWYQSVLPDDIVRLHTRPAFNQPNDYLRWLSDRAQLPDSGKPAQKQR
ncbi:Rz-like lysis system protein LysB [Pectobacteriaceae bacterium CE70]|uniref:P2 LysB n=1 Tax=Serratia sp. (strain ATCC 39006) TaxID=104623 RepID=A0A2I5TL64_SERS3|nr:Rz-like lysis system protein LysB [Serratia sp. ATCC 39006]WJV64397.1 Rz-like lysis system protein LysB [Pectobacteriaceae bacterium C52]WJV65171.1 Rz-like lysis system protein LysB [Pectobacteriaceae bacterium CE70]WJY09185.1 Rz-like lysis system protein LysB [Pectobacteriaceae bacterium C80]AUH00977.1 P2 LysB [Serratia sp. ATCC 39006]AUH05298.1 P2 LysB [Serratia sp. ATCC 39006]